MGRSEEEEFKPSSVLEVFAIGFAAIATQFIIVSIELALFLGKKLWQLGDLSVKLLLKENQYTEKETENPSLN